MEKLVEIGQRRLLITLCAMIFIVLLTLLPPVANTAQAQSADCTFFEPDQSTWQTDGDVLVNETVSAIPILARPNSTCTLDLSPVQPGGRVLVLVDNGDYLYIRHIDDGYRNAWVQSDGLSNPDASVNCEFYEPDQNTWQTDGDVLVNETVSAIPILARPNNTCTLDLPPVQPGGRVLVLVDNGDYLYIRHVDDGYRNAWVQSDGLSNPDASVNCDFYEPDQSTWMPEGPVLVNQTDSKAFMLARPNSVCRTDLASVQPGGRVLVLVDLGEYLYVRHIDDNFRNAWVQSSAFSDQSDVSLPTEPTSGPQVSGNTILLPDDGWYQVQAILDGKAVEVCSGTRSCEVSAGTYIVINHTTGERFEGVIVDGEVGVGRVSVTGNTIFWPDDGWYQVQTVLDGQRVEVCAGTRSCQVANGSYTVINHTNGQRYADITVDGDSGVSIVIIHGNTIFWPDNGWYQVQTVRDGQIVEVCAGTRSCVVVDGSYIVINHTTGERMEQVVVDTGSTVDEWVEPMVVPTSEVKPFLPAGPYASVLADCAFVKTQEEYEEPCTLATLPYIGQRNSAITVDDVLERTLVTHGWMGKRFGRLLAAMPADMLPLFAPVTSVVIGSEVRPSAYNAYTGRIMIDPDFLWLTVPEKLTISRNSDFRRDFGAELKFVSYWRWMRGDDYAIFPSSLDDEQTREFDDVIPLAAGILYHELAHANDFVRAQNLELISAEMTPGEAADMFPEQRLASQLYADEALTVLRSPLYGLARVRYEDKPASDVQKSVFADAAGSLMANEGKQNFYGYFTIYEDVATLFEHTMMRYHFGVETLVGFMNKPEGHPEADCNDYKVAWGVRNRLAAPQVAGRARFITEQLIGRSASLDTFFDEAIGVQTPLRQGDGWCDARFQTPRQITAQSRAGIDDKRQFAFERRYFLK